MWTDTNIDFRRQEIRHCCKQTGEKVTLEEIDALGPDVFDHYATNLKNRKTMLFDNKIPKSCGVCAVNGDNAIRHAWNIWSDEQVDAVRQLPIDVDKTHYIEIDIGDKCDLACVYCGPWSSSTWKKELGYGVQEKSEHAKTWTDKVMGHLVTKIKSLDSDERISINFLGGEPTLMNGVYDFLDKISPTLQNRNHPVNLMFTTNLNTKDVLFDRWMNTLERTKDYSYWTIGVSVENVGRKAELVRYGLDWQRFTENLKTVQHKGLIAFTCTHNYFSLPSYAETLEFFFENMDTEFASKDLGTGWLITPNCVYDNVLDPAYLKQEYVDWDGIYATLDKYVGREKDKNLGYHHLYDHIDAMRERVGTKKQNRKFYEYYRNLVMRTPDYLECFPYLKKDLELLEQEFGGSFEKDHFAWAWKNPLSPEENLFGE